MEVDIADEDLAGHTIINGYNPSNGELSIAVNLVKYLTEEYIEIEERDATGNSLLHTAATRGLPLVVLALLQKGADPNSINHQGQRIWFSTAVALQDVENELSKKWETSLHYQHGRLVDCLDLLERAPGFSVPQSAAPSRHDSSGKERDNFPCVPSQHRHVRHIQAAATSFKKAFWPW
jgi:hypothetical protein